MEGTESGISLPCLKELFGFILYLLYDTTVEARLLDGKFHGACSLS